MTRDDLPAWRSMLFVPLTVEKFVSTAADRGADAIILDLEDCNGGLRFRTFRYPTGPNSFRSA